MTQPRKSAAEAISLGQALRARRQELNLTLKVVAKKLTIDVGQLSRFERGDFTFVTGHVQRFADYLQTPTGPPQTTQQLAVRFEAVAKRSPRHEVAALALLEALEVLR